MTQPIPRGATDRACVLFSDLIEGHWEKVDGEFDASLRGQVDLARGWAGVVVSLLSEGLEIAPGRVAVAVAGPGQTTVTVTLSGLGNITLWNIDQPKLYHATTNHVQAS